MGLVGGRTVKEVKLGTCAVEVLCFKPYFGAKSTNFYWVCVVILYRPLPDVISSGGCLTLMMIVTAPMIECYLRLLFLF